MLGRTEALDEQAVWRCAEVVPPDWYGETSDIERLVEQLLIRRVKIPELIAQFKDSSRQPFPNWKDTVN